MSIRLRCAIGSRLRWEWYLHSCSGVSPWTWCDQVWHWVRAFLFGGQGMRILSRVSRWGGFAGATWRAATRFVRIRLLAVLLLVITAAVLTAVSPVALKVVVDRVAELPGGRAASLPALVAVYVACQWLARTAAEARGLLYARAERRVFRTISERLFAHVMRLPLRLHLQRRTGAITQTLDSGLEGSS
jgi:ABC-type multidrug transport system fused ATPase/permease subunit